MKLLPTATLFLTSLFVTTTLANLRIEFDDLPSKLRAGASYEVKWTANQDYKLDEFLLVHESPHQSGWAPVRVIDHYLNMSAGTSSTMWKVPALKNKRRYGLWLSAGLYGEENLPVTNRTSSAALTNWFEVEGGPTLYPKEIAGVVVGTVVACVLIIAAVVLVPRCVRKRRSVAVDLS